MNIVFNENVSKKHNIEEDEFLILLTINEDINYEKVIEQLLTKGLIGESYSEEVKSGYFLTLSVTEIMNNIIADSITITEVDNNELEKLAQQLKEIFPKGKKDGTSFYWSEGVKLIVRRLKIFFKKYGYNHTADEIINAAEQYVEGFNGNYQYMQLLKYFIFKEKKGVAGDIEGESALLTHLDNVNEITNLKNDWTSTLK